MKLNLTDRAVKDLHLLERSQPKIVKRIIAKIQSLSDSPTEGKPLVGPLKGKWSLRVADYRIIYQFNKTSILILTINHRKEVYR